MNILIAIIHLSDWHTLAVWRATSRASFEAVAVVLRRRYEAHVSPFVSNQKIPLLDDILRDTGAIICGSTALHFLLPDVSWSPTTLDIYVPAERYRRFLFTVADPVGLNWKRIHRRHHNKCVVPRSGVADLDPGDRQESASDIHAHTVGIASRFDAYTNEEVDRNSDNYEAIDDPPQRDMHDRKHLHMVLGTGCRAMRRMCAPNGRIIRLMCSSSNNPVSPLRDSFSSLVMNFLTPDACVCGFPSATLDRLGVIKYCGLSPRERSYRNVYRKRGFRFEADGPRQDLDPWHMVFFGARIILAVDFRHNLRDPLYKLPVKSTVRGWVSNPEWLR